MNSGKIIAPPYAKTIPLISPAPNTLTTLRTHIHNTYPVPKKQTKAQISLLIPSHSPLTTRIPPLMNERNSPLTLLNNGWLTNALFTTGPSPMLGPYAACAAAMLGGECEMKPMEMKMMRRLSQTALCLYAGR